MKTHRPWSVRLTIAAAVTLLLTALGGCSLIDELTNPLAGTWVYSATDGYYDDNYTYHTLYAEETLALNADKTMRFTGTHFSSTVTLSRNDFGGLYEYTLSGTYVLDGSRLSITFDGDSRPTNYYRQ